MIGFNAPVNGGEPIDIEVAGEQGVEPRLSDPETDVLPLDDSPAKHNYHKLIMFCQVFIF